MTRPEMIASAIRTWCRSRDALDIAGTDQLATWIDGHLSPHTDFGELPAWIVFRYDLQRDAYVEVGCANAPNAGGAFRTVVMPPHRDATDRCGSYRIFRLADAGHFAIELTLRDLTGKETP